MLKTRSAWTRTRKKARVFFTTLGHPRDFDNESIRRLLVNGIDWALGMEDRIPPQDTDVTAPPSLSAHETAVRRQR